MSHGHRLGCIDGVGAQTSLTSLPPFGADKNPEMLRLPLSTPSLPLLNLNLCYHIISYICSREYQCLYLYQPAGPRPMITNGPAITS